LVEEHHSGAATGTVENFRLSEINARFSFNGFMLLAYGQQALHDIGVCDGRNGLVGATDPAKVSRDENIPDVLSVSHRLVSPYLCDALLTYAN
jgi:hypothetical protein